MIPVLFEERVLAVIELASFRSFSPIILQFLDAHGDDRRGALHDHRERPHRAAPRAVAVAVERAELSQALQRQQDSWETNELQEKAELLERQNRDIEIKNREIELARSSLEEAEQLALSSVQVGVPGEHVARAAHAARSLLILSKVLPRTRPGT